MLRAGPAQSRLPGHCPVKFCVFPRIPRDPSALLRKQASPLSQETNPMLRLFVALPFARGSQARSSPVTLQGWVLSTALPAEPLPAAGGWCKPPGATNNPPDSAGARRPPRSRSRQRLEEDEQPPASLRGARTPSPRLQRGCHRGSPSYTVA